MKTETIWLIAAVLVVACGVLWLRARPAGAMFVGVPSTGAPPVVPSSYVDAGTYTPTVGTRTGRGAF